ncbi:hypothetical protein C1752_08257 [Acaryochloris thomasi RCC1774]|uniref:Uncharacterized protein n=1 Tax=Acaryochloris thomasi RCC1774 TaxID=1764569 RepID=A0A2W1JLH9_9CYAN|nr:hypothetical protein [Acaryochloris thomasi]PZD71054.1 hypothetical protein C1752_08257 [Acaryochloris thomasi RCC1774]
MKIEDVLSQFRGRVSWPTMRAILKKIDLQTSQGWDQTIAKLKEYQKSNRDEALIAVDNLKRIYLNYLLAGEKAVKLFTVEESKLNRLMVFLQKHSVKENVFQETYPFPLSEEKLKNLNSSPKLLEVREIDGDLGLVFCTKRFFTERSTINSKDYSIEVEKALDDFDEIVGIRRYTRQFFDIVFLRKESNMAEIRIDIGGGMLEEDRRRSFLEIGKSFNKLAHDYIGVADFLKTPLNFFPLIETLYNSDEGKVGEIAFTTDEGSTKFERMRRGAKDLRLETYHKAGRAELEKFDQKINLYKIAILWKFSISDDIETEPELFLPGNSFFLNQEYPVLEEAIIKKCSELEDYNFVFNKIKHYLDGCG